MTLRHFNRESCTFTNESSLILGREYATTDEIVLLEEELSDQRHVVRLNLAILRYRLRHPAWTNGFPFLELLTSDDMNPSPVVENQ